MIVVSDTSPLTALMAVGQEDILKKLFGEVIIPEAVRNELQLTHPSLPDWVVVRVVQSSVLLAKLSLTLDPGECEAIVLAKELQADHLLIDERKGRRVAGEQNVPVVGLLGVILMARKGRIIPSARNLLNRIDREAGFYLSEQVKEAALKKVGE